MEKKSAKFSLYIIGTTATGKTKLSLSLGQNFKGEIVSADSMQIYKGADILTAKATKEEQAQVKHHMLDIFDLNVKDFNRNDYYHMAIQAFDKVYANNSFPIVVGGTNYYIETLLFNQKISESRFCQETQEQDEEYLKIKEKVLSMTQQERIKELNRIDPLISNKLHSNDERRIINYLIQGLSTNQPPSASMENHENVPLREKNCLIFWPRCSSKEKLNQQIRKRINEMVSEEGILEAIKIFEYLIPTNYLTISEDNESLDLLQITYGAIVNQIVKDTNTIAEANQLLENLGFDIGQRMADEFTLKQTAKTSLDLKELAQIYANDALESFTGIRADIEDFKTVGKDIMFSMVMNNKPLADYVEIPEYINGLQYNNIICGVIKGAIYQLLFIGKVYAQKDILLGDEKTVIRVEVRREKLKEDD